jgi:hypothetical protein
MNRRKMIAALSGAGAWPLSARAQHAASQLPHVNGLTPSLVGGEALFLEPGCAACHIGGTRPITCKLHFARNDSGGPADELRYPSLEF